MKTPQLSLPRFCRQALGLTVLSTISSLSSAVVFQAEDYTAAHDLSAGNTGGAYRNENVDIEATQDVGGGYNVGWIEQGEWLALGNLSIAQSGTYKVSVRVASNQGAKISVDLNAGQIPLGEFDIPNTGGWQTWQTVTKTVTLDAGEYSIGSYASTGNFNFNWLEVTPENVSGGNGSSIKIEAEDYGNFFDTTPANLGGAYRNDGVDIEQTNDDGGGHSIGWVDAGEWLVYPSITIPQSGNYKVHARVASPTGGKFSLDLNANAVALGELNVPATGGWQNWQTASMDTYIEAGTYNLGVFASTGGWNLNWIEITSGGNGTTNPPPQPPGRNLVWGDEFDTIDRNTWNFEVGGGGWGNNELQYYTNGDNAFIEYDGQAGSNVLVIEARKELGGDCWFGGRCEYTSTRMNTRHRKSFKFGRIEARIKLPKAQGIWPAFWMLGDAFNDVGWPQGGEIDIMEHVGTNNITSGALHGPGYSGATPVTGHLDHPTDISTNYKTYAVEWDANGIHWYIDDVNFYNITKGQVEQYGQWVYDKPFWILLNVAVGGNWPGSPAGDYTTQRMYVDYVRVYQ